MNKSPNGKCRIKLVKAIAAYLFILVASAATGNSTEYQVAISGRDTNPGTAAAPLRTIQHAADLAQPGDTVTVHAGVYRERIDPPRGGASNTRRITYRAAPGEIVEIAGSEVVKKWTKVENNLWKTVLPNRFFGSFNPYQDKIFGDWYRAAEGRTNHTGCVYVNGQWLMESRSLAEINGNGQESTGTSKPPLIVNMAWFQPRSEKQSAPVVHAETFADSHGKGLGKSACQEGGRCIGWISPGFWVHYREVDFGDRADQIDVRCAGPGALVEFHLDSPEGIPLGSCQVDNTGGWQAWDTFSASIKPVSGKHDLYVVFKDKARAPAGHWFATVDSDNTTIWISQTKDGVDPNRETTEINVRRTVFYPSKTGINYITLRGFVLRDAATPWAPPTAEQIGLVGTNWSKGWIIENNRISHSVCAGIALGKYGDKWDNTACLPGIKGGSAMGYVDTIKRAVANGWSKENIGHHIVRNNEIFKCGQVGVVGSLGAVFSSVTGNSIHDIYDPYVKQMFGGAEMAGIKFHAAVDVRIAHNHIYRCGNLGIWLDWMAQGARISCNLLHDNDSDVFTEVDHGPILFDNNLFLSPGGVHTCSQGLACAHNLICGGISDRSDQRQTPLFKAHSVAVVNFLENNPFGDKRYYNNLFIGAANLTIYDDHPKEKQMLPVTMDGNVFSRASKPSALEKNPLILDGVPGSPKVEERNGHYYLTMNLGETGISGAATRLITTETLGKTAVSGESFENPDGTPLKIGTDYFGNPRNPMNPTPGCFESPKTGSHEVRVW